MIYYIFYELIFGHFKDRWSVVRALNVFQYVTFRTAYATVTALLISLVFGRRVINGLRDWNIGQQIREEGPQAHIAKRDTPTMGGILIIASVVISTLLWARLSGLYIWLTILATLGFGGSRGELRAGPRRDGRARGAGSLRWHVRLLGLYALEDAPACGGDPRVRRRLPVGESLRAPRLHDRP